MSFYPLTLKEAKKIIDQLVRQNAEQRRMEDPDGRIGKVEKIEVGIHINLEGHEDEYDGWSIAHKEIAKSRVLTKGEKKPKFYEYRQHPTDGCIFVEPDGKEWIVKKAVMHSKHSGYYVCTSLKTGEEKTFEDKNDGFFNVVRKAEQMFVDLEGKNLTITK
jgi:hypothetical protein